MSKELLSMRTFSKKPAEEVSRQAPPPEKGAGAALSMNFQ
jgi:hypothetical protein